MPVADWDLWISHTINGLAGRSTFLDLLVVKFLMLSSIKVLPLILCVVWLWFDERAGRDRELKLGQMLAGAAIALTVSRVLQNLLPARPRPIYSGNDFITPIGTPDDILHDWSSFPSDNTALAIALAFGIWRVSRGFGSFALLWAVLVVALSRIFAGYHYFSDVMTGAVIGIVSVWVAVRIVTPRTPGAGLVRHLRQKWKPAFFCLMFLALYQIGTMFEDVRIIAQGADRYFEGEGKYAYR